MNARCFVRLSGVLFLVLTLPVALLAGPGALTPSAGAPDGLHAVPPPPAVLEKLRQEGRPLPAIMQTKRERGIDQPHFPVPPSGSFNLLAVAVDFSDNPGSITTAFFDALIFAPPGPSSVTDYYDEISYGTLTLVTVNPPSTMGWVRAARTYNGASGYVNADGIAGTGDDYGWGSYPQNLQGIVADVLPLIDPLVNFSQYDNDNDGFVDSVLFVHAGPGAEITVSPNDIWSSSWNMSVGKGPGPVMTQDGVSVDRFAFGPEYMYGPGDQTIGVYCHELGHTLFGLPDLYDLGWDGTWSYGVGYWSLMGFGSWNGPAGLGGSPAWPDAWTRTVMGFEHPQPTDGFVLGYPFSAIELGPSWVIRLQSPQLGPHEYFLIENRQPIGYDTFLPGRGLLIWHVDEEKWNAWEGNTYECIQPLDCQCPVWHYLLSLEQADGLLDLEKYVNAGDAGDPFPGTSGNMTFGFGTNPESDSWYASPCPSDSCIAVTITTVFPGPPDLIIADVGVVCLRSGGCLNILPAGQVGWGQSGTDALYRASVQNCSNAFDFAVTLSSSSAWPTTIHDPFTGQPISQTALFPGAAWYVGITATVPANALPGDLDVATLLAVSSWPGISTTAFITTRVPNCVLLVDDDRGTPDVETAYTTALDNLNIAFDYWDTNVEGRPDLATLTAHQAVIWFTGNGAPQYDTLSPREEVALATFLDGGGQLFLVSQDYLWDVGRSDFSRDYLRIATYITDTGTLTVAGVPGDPVGGSLPGPYPLNPVAWYSDRINPHPPASGSFTDDAGLTNALTYNSGTWKVLFLAWPFENLAQQDADAVMASAMGWFGIQPRVVASFDVSPSPVRVGETVTFTDTSSGTPNIWAWDLDGDGTVDSTDANPTWQYDTPGTYLVTLAITRTAGCASCADSVSDSVEVLPSSVYVYLPIVIRGQP